MELQSKFIVPLQLKVAVGKNVVEKLVSTKETIFFLKFKLRARHNIKTTTLNTSRLIHVHLSFLWHSEHSSHSFSLSLESTSVVITIKLISVVAVASSRVFKLVCITLFVLLVPPSQITPRPLLLHLLFLSTS